MDVIFVRHGRAEDLKDKQDDSKRQLTPKGKKEILRIISEAKKNLKEDYKILIWTSSALRAEQTAQIISDELNADTISSFDFIKDGDYDSLIKQFDNVDENSTVFIVGHEPYLSRWSKFIYNARIPFNKGTMVGFELQSRNPYKGELIWIVNSNLSHYLDSTDKSNNDELTLNKYKQMMIDILNEITDMQKLYLEMPDDIESAHQIRVKIRQLRSLLSFIKPILSEQDYKQNQGKLEEIAKRFSYIREIDVLIEHWQSILEKNLDLTTDKSALMKVLRDEREKEKSLMIEYISQGLMNVDLSCISTQISGWDDKKDILLKRFALKRFKSWNKKAVKKMKNIDFSSLNEIHTVRIQLKKLRYVQNSIGLFSANNGWRTPKLKAIQDDLGSICDVYNNIAILKSLNSKYRKPLLQYETGILTGYCMCSKEDLIKKIKSL